MVPASTLLSQNLGMGLFIMRERVALVGGQLEITDIGKQGTHIAGMNVLDTYVRRPHQHGTRVRATIPLHPEGGPLSHKHERKTGNFIV
jgi:glucose-6-phosphate-specific signal transduction histidine kinase